MQIVPTVAIDFGSTHIRAAVGGSERSHFSDRSLLVREVVSGEVVAVGSEADQYVLQPGEELVRPVQDGVLVDYRGAVVLLEHALASALSWWQLFRPRVVVAESLAMSRAMSQALGEALRAAGASTVYTASVPVLAALGADIDPTTPVGGAVLDIGSGTTEAGIVARGSLATATTESVGGDELAAAVSEYVATTHEAVITRTTAQEILRSVGSALQRDSDKTYEFYAQEADSGESVALSITSNEVAEAVAGPLRDITDVARRVITHTPTTLLSDVAEKGMLVTGGVARLDYIDTYLQRELSLPVQIVADPETAVIRGGRRALPFITTYRQSVPRST